MKPYDKLCSGFKENTESLNVIFVSAFQTESDLIKAIGNLEKELTFIFIAHRISTIKECDIIYEFEDGEVKAFGNYEELILRSNTFKAMIKKNSDNF